MWHLNNAVDHPPHKISLCILSKMQRSLSQKPTLQISQHCFPPPPHPYAQAPRSTPGPTSGSPAAPSLPRTWRPSGVPRVSAASTPLTSPPLGSGRPTLCSQCRQRRVCDSRWGGVGVSVRGLGWEGGGKGVFIGKGLTECQRRQPSSRPHGTGEEAGGEQAYRSVVGWGGAGGAHRRSGHALTPPTQTLSVMVPAP